MFLINNLNLWLMLLLVTGRIEGLSFNQPKLSPCAAWDPVATIFVANETLGKDTAIIFINQNNMIYVLETALNRVQVWLEGSVIPSRNITGGLNYSHSLFVTDNGDVYIDNGYFNGRVEKWTINSTSGLSVMNVSGMCFGLFIDTNDTLYCSLGTENTVLKIALNSGNTTSVIAAGNGSPGLASNMLKNPHGIVVDLSFNLYVADCNNNRIPRFSSGQLNGTTVAGDGAPGTVSLNCPTEIVLDADGYLFFTDYNNNRIIGSNANGFRCIVGCLNISGSFASQLYTPYSLKFDTYGNIFVSDLTNHRIQKFSLATNSCGLSANQPKFCLSAIWNLNAITFANNSTVGTNPYGLFVSVNNTVYVVDTASNSIQIWLEEDTTPSTNLSGWLSSPLAIFVTSTGDIYVDNGYSRGRVYKLTSNGTNHSIAMFVNASCRGLFVDTSNSLYCSLTSLHKVIKKLSNDNANTTTIVAGNGINGSASDMLNLPQTIFVDSMFNLYVADYFNHRIQLFQAGQLNGTTVAGAGANGTIALLYPVGIVLDADGHLFISDTGNSRIVGSGPNGFRCIVGCSDTSGAGVDQLEFPCSISFDSDGNLFVADASNNRIQKFTLATNSCNWSEWYGAISQLRPILTSFIIGSLMRVSYNQPKLCPSATWNPNATTFADINQIGTDPYGIFIDINNTVYLPEYSRNLTQVWLEGSHIPIRNISSGLSNPYTVFVAINGDIYVDNGLYNHRIDKWTLNATNSTNVMYVNGSCYGLFVDIYNNIYCSYHLFHQVIKQSFGDNANITTVIAGNGTAGSGPIMLDDSRGIYVDVKLNLYVADCGNNRIQLFQSDSRNGITILGNDTIGTITLSCPTGIAVDANGYLFISDTQGNRVVGSDINGFRCIVGCTDLAGSASDQLNLPRSINFDSHGNLFVVDRNNSRIQTFLLATNSCNETTTYSYVPMSTVSTIQSSTNSIQLTLGAPQSSHYFLPSTCLSFAYIGAGCNISASACDIFTPCQNNATCVNNNSAFSGYTCLCLLNVNGTQCQLDNRPCQSNTCWNNGTCRETTNTTFECICPTGWQGIYCETMINYCADNVCVNQGVCQPLLLNYTCQCLDQSYSGRHCEVRANKVLVFQFISKSLASVVIMAMLIAALFIITLDVLKYFFGIDPVGDEMKLIEEIKRQTKKKSPVIIRYIYVNEPPIPTFDTVNALEKQTSV